MKRTYLIILIIVIVLVGTVWSSYNRLVTLDEAATTAWSNVETTYQRRLDLIPNLIESVKGFLTQEQEILNNIADARTRYAGAQSVSERATALQNLETGLGRLMAVVENYPNLRSSELFQNLMVELEGTENRVAVARRDYNEVVRQLNTNLRRFPTNIIGSMFGFEKQTLFEAAEGAEEAPKVNFATE